MTSSLPVRRAGQLGVVASLVCVLSACSDRRAAPATPPGSVAPAAPAVAAPSIDARAPAAFWAERGAHRTQLRRRGPSPQGYDESVPDGFQVVHYRSAGRDLMAWFAKPAPAAGATRRPALLFSHGGYALGEGDELPARRFLEAGFVVMVPAYRGENGNPGDHEMMLGEVDDAVEAVRWLAARPDVDPARIYALGHSAGGMIASMLALVPDLPLAATGSIDALYDETLFTSQPEVIPFDPSDATEVKYRLLLPNIAALVRPHRAYLASDGYAVTLRAQADAEARQAGVALTTHVVPGDHTTCVEPATEAFFEHVRGLETARK